MRSNDRFRGIGRKRHLTRKRLVQNTCQGVDVYRRGDLLVGKPFGRHVGPGTDLGTGRREAGIAHHFGDAEIDQVSEIGWRDNDVLRLDIAMNQALGVRRVQRRGDLGDYGHGSRRIQRRLVDQALQVRPPDQTHVDEQAAVDLSEAMDRDDMRFLQLRRGV